MHTKDCWTLLFTTICLCFCIVFFGNQSYAASFTEENLIYTENEDGTLTVTGYDPSQYIGGTQLEIKNTVNGKRVANIADYAFQGKQFEYIAIDNNIDIGAFAFENVTVDGKLPDAFAEIIPEPWKYCIYIGNDTSGANRIGQYAFASAQIHQKIILNSNVSIGNSAFRNSFLGGGICQPESIVTHIGNNAFDGSYYTSGLNYSGLISVGSNAFKGCSLTEFTISSTLKTLDATFSGGTYSDYFHIYIEEDVTDISSFQLENLDFTIFHISADSPLATYCAKHNMLFTIIEDGNPDTIYPKPITGQLISNDTFDVVVTGESTAELFRLKSATDSITFDETAIVDYHGYQYTITSLRPNSILCNDFPYLQTILFGNTITRVAFGAIVDPTYNITYISFSNTDTITEMGSFPNSNSLTVEFLPSVTNLNSYFLTDSTQVTFLVEEGSPLIQMLVDRNLTFQTHGNKPISPGSPDYPEKTPTEPSTDTPLAPNAPNALDPNQTLPDPIPGTGGSTNSTANTKEPAIGDVFTYKKLQYKITGKKTVTFVKPANKKITKISLPSSVIYITNKKKYKYKVTKVEKKACYKYSKLKTVTIGENVTSIGDSAFAKCGSLKQITFGANVKTIGKKVLYHDKKLKKIKFKGTKVKSIGKKTFRKVPKSVEIIVPNSKVKKYSRLINKAI